MEAPVPSPAVSLAKRGSQYSTPQVGDILHCYNESPDEIPATRDCHRPLFPLLPCEHPPLLVTPGSSNMAPRVGSRKQTAGEGNRSQCAENPSESLRLMAADACMPIAEKTAHHEFATASPENADIGSAEGDQKAARLKAELKLALQQHNLALEKCLEETFSSFASCRNREASVDVAAKAETCEVRKEWSQGVLQSAPESYTLGSVRPTCPVQVVSGESAVNAGGRPRQSILSRATAESYMTPPAVEERREMFRSAKSNTFSAVSFIASSEASEARRRQAKCSTSSMPSIVFRSNTGVPFLPVLGEAVVVIAILCNGIVVGLQTDYMAQKRTDNAPVYFQFSEFVFCFIFTAELLVKLWIHRWQYYASKSWQWNLFDTVLVLLQWMDIAFIFSGSNTEPMQNTNVLRMMRTLRILRIARLVRLMRFLGQVNVVWAAICASFRSLIGMTFLLLLIMYIVGVAFTLMIIDHRACCVVDRSSEDTELDYWWGSVGRSILSLYEAVFGGTDWDNLVGPLINSSPMFGVMFSLYIAFMVLTILNVFTGIFVESAVRHAGREGEHSFKKQMRLFYKVADTDTSGTINEEEFEVAFADNQDLQDYMKDMGIDANEVKLLFQILDVDHNGEVNAEEFIEGLVRLRKGARFIDVMRLLYEFENQRRTLEQLVTASPSEQMPASPPLS